MNAMPTRHPHRRMHLSVFAVTALALVTAGGPLAAQTRVLDIAGITLELSAAAAVPGGVLVADDELVGSVLFVTRDALAQPDGAPRASLVTIDRARKHSQPNSELSRLFAVQDFEGVAANDDGSRVYLVGSHAPTNNGRHRRTDREFLIKARWDPGEPELRVRKAKKSGVPGIYRGLIDGLEGQVNASGPAGFNVEGLALREGSLYIGLRAPLSEGETGKALIFSAREKELFGEGSENFNGPFTRLALDLGGAGVRGLHWDEVTGRLLVLSGPSSNGGDVPSALWSYDFTSGALALEYRFGAEQLREHGAPEGITRFDAHQLLIVFDSDEAEHARLMFLPWN